MEEAKAPDAASPLTTTTKKMPLDSDPLFQISNYVKIRALVGDLRPLFIQVVQAPDYQNCNASHEIREQLKILMKLYDNLKAGVVSLEKSKNMQDSQNLDHKTLQEQHPQHFKSPEQLQVEKASARSSEDCQTHGTYVVGGSAFGWNFITFSGNEPVYYGRTKEQFRAVNQLTNSPAATGLNPPQPLV